MKRIIVNTIFILVLFLLQCTFFQTFALANISPNLLLVLTACSGFMRGKKEGMLVGLFSGLLIDIFYGDLFGFYGLVYMYIGYVNGFFNMLFYADDIKLPLSLVAGSEVVYGFVIYLFRFLLRNRLNFGYYFGHIILPELLYTIVVTLLLYRLILGINKWVDGIGKRGAKFVD